MNENAYDSRNDSRQLSWREWDLNDQYEAGEFCRKIMDRDLMKYLSRAVQFAHRKENVSRETFWKYVSLTQYDPVTKKKFPSLASTASVPAGDPCPEDPYRLLDFQAYNKYLRFDRNWAVLERHGEILEKVEDGKARSFFKTFGIGWHGEYQNVVLSNAIDARNTFSHTSEKSEQEITQKLIKSVFRTMKLQTLPLARNGEFSRSLDRPLGEFWKEKEEEFLRLFGMAPVDYYEIAEEILMEQPLSAEHEQTLREAMCIFQNLTQGHLVYQRTEKEIRDYLRQWFRVDPAAGWKDPQRVRQQAQEESRRLEQIREKARQQAACENRKCRLEKMDAASLRALTQKARMDQRTFHMQDLALRALLQKFRLIADETLVLSEDGRSLLTKMLGPILKELRVKIYMDESSVTDLFRQLRETRPLSEESGKTMVLSGALSAEQVQQVQADRAICHTNVKNAIKALDHLVRQGCLVVSRSLLDGEASYENILEVTSLDPGRSYLVLTMDGQLAQALAGLAAGNAVAAKVTPDGDLLLFRDTSGSFRKILEQTEHAAQEEQGSCAPMPEAGDTVILKTPEGSQLLRLQKRLGEGGEGAIYETDSLQGLVAKIYHSEAQAAARREKLEAMVLRNPRIPGLCWPCGLLYDQKDRWIGYLMPKAEGWELAGTVFRSGMKGANLKKLGWDRRSIALIAENVAKVFEAMHSRGIYMGDVNPRNFLVSRTCQVSLVDCDSYQFEGFTCPVGTDLYTPPEVHRRIRSGLQKGFDYVRTEENERYSLAVLLFEIIMLGKAPYVSRNQEVDNVVDFISDGDFPYPFGKNAERKDAPTGQWRSIWSNTTYALKEKFYNTFTNGQRPSAAQWAATMAEYGRLIESGRSTRELTPYGYKDVSENGVEGATAMVELVCQRCGNPFQIAANVAETKQKRGEPILCPEHEGIRRSLGEKPQMLRCCSCGRSYMGTVLDYIEWKQKKKYCYCESCAVVTMECECCGQSFPVPRDKAIELRQKHRGFVCRDCRKDYMVDVVCEDCGRSFKIPRPKYEKLQEEGKDILCGECLRQRMESWNS